MQAHHLEDPSHPRKQPIAAAVAAAIATTRHVLAVSLPQQGQGDVRLPGDPSNGQFWVCSPPYYDTISAFQEASITRFAGHEPDRNAVVLQDVLLNLLTSAQRGHVWQNDSI